MLRRLSVLVLMVGTISACGSVVAIGESPTSVLATAAQRADGLHSFRVQFDATVSYPVPAQMLQLFGGGSGAAGSSGATATFQAAFKGAVKVVKPDRMAMDASIKFNSFSIDISTMRIGADSYTKNILTGQWEKDKTASGDSSTSSSKQINSLDPAAFTDLLKYLTVQDTLPDTDVNGTHVHHYRVRVDAGKLKAELKRRGALKDDASSKALDDFLAKNGYKMEIWIGTSDHLVRRIKIDVDTTTDASTLGSLSLGAGGSPKTRNPALGLLTPEPTPTPSPQPVHVTGHVQLDYTDFDKPLEVSPPPVP